MEDCKLKLNLEDKPGALSIVLETIAKNRGNLFSVSHIREMKKDDKVPVVISFQDEEDDFNRLISDLESAGIEIIEKKIGATEQSQATTEFILIGHIIDTDIKDTIYSICSKNVMVKTLDINLKSLKEQSSAFVRIGAGGRDDLTDAIEKIKKVAEDKNLLLIPSI